MRRIMISALLAATSLVAACHTVRGVRQDAASVGRVFSKHPDAKATPPNR